MINWSEFKTTKEELQTISKICDRAMLDLNYDRMSLMMDIEVAHHECKLRLDDLLATDDFNFMHDVVGIINHLDRNSGKLQHCFLPRFATQ